MSERALKYWTLALTASASFMVALDLQVVTLALPSIRLHLGASLGALEWILNAYSTTFAVLLITGAALGDRFGRRRLFVAGVGLFLAASAACALARNPAMLIAARAIQGAGGALIMPLAMALLSAAFPRAERGKALGIFASVTGLAMIAGPIAGGALTQGLTWQWIFWINLPIGVVIVPLTLARVRESAAPEAKFDLIGVVLASAATFGLVWGLTQGNALALCGGLALAFTFVWWERRARAPMVPLRLFRSRAFAAGNAASFLYYAAIYGMLFFLTQFFQVAQGYGPLGAGLRLLVWTATLFVIAPLAGAAINRVGERSLIVAGTFLQAVGMLWLILTVAPAVPYAALVAPLLVTGIGASMAMPALQNAVLSAVGAAEIGKASGTFNMLRFLGGTFGIAVLGALFARTGSLSSPQAFTHGFVAAVGLASAFALLAALAGLAVPHSVRTASAVAMRAATPAG